MSLLQAVEMQTRYMELFTLSGDYFQYLGAMEKNMEELKVAQCIKCIQMVFKLNSLKSCWLQHINAQVVKLKYCFFNVYYIKHYIILKNSLLWGFGCFFTHPCVMSCIRFVIPELISWRKSFGCSRRTSKATPRRTGSWRMLFPATSWISPIPRNSCCRWRR